VLAPAFFKGRPADEVQHPDGEPVHAGDEQEQRPPAAMARAMQDLLNRAIRVGTNKMRTTMWAGDISIMIHKPPGMSYNVSMS
jgi:hypothetical protein